MSAFGVKAEMERAAALLSYMPPLPADTMMPLVASMAWVFGVVSKRRASLPVVTSVVHAITIAPVIEKVPRDSGQFSQ
jgi:hypothetical protein